METFQPVFGPFILFDNGIDGSILIKKTKEIVTSHICHNFVNGAPKESNV